MTSDEIENLKKRCQLADEVVRLVFKYSECPNQFNELALAKAIENYNNYLEAIGAPHE